MAWRANCDERDQNDETQSAASLTNRAQGRRTRPPTPKNTLGRFRVLAW